MTKCATCRALGVLGFLSALGGVATAQADQPKLGNAPKIHPAKPTTPRACIAHPVGYKASGTLVAATLAPTTAGRYSGTLTVNVLKANHHGPTGPAKFTLTHAQVTFKHGISPTAPAAGSRVKLHGTITALPAKCSTTGFAPTITVNRVKIKPKQ